MGGRYSVSIPVFCSLPVEPPVYEYTLGLGPFLLIYCASFLSKKKFILLNNFAFIFFGQVSKGVILPHLDSPILYLYESRQAGKNFSSLKLCF